MIVATHALRSWLQQNGIVPEDVTVVLRTKTPEAELHLAKTIAQEFSAALPGTEQMSYPSCRAYHIKVHGMHVVIASLDTSARIVESK